VLVVSGVTQGITLIVRVLRAAGVVDIAVESPSNPVQRQVLARYGLRVWDVPVDDQGLVVDALTRTPCRAVIVTPGHQFPCGMVLSASRRGALTRWAENADGVVIEDDYDGMLRHDRMHIGALQMLSPARVALVGSVSKSLAPGLRLGWIVSPPRLVADLQMAKRDDDFGTGVLQQYVLARLLVTGEYDRHVRRIRRHYRQRRDTVIEVLRREIPDATVEGFTAGLHLLLRLPHDVDEARYIAAAEQEGVAVLGVSQMYGTLPSQPGVIIQYGRATPSMLQEAAKRLGAAVKAARSTQRVELLPRKVNPTAQRRPSTAVDYF
jgi:GntR family transcriptional regulator/MocR family aminotransferase